MVFTGANENEAKFNADELFYSKTDFRGIIQSGNSVFVRVSEYPEEELLKRPHNVIRHPDMPRAVFALFWDFLKNQKVVAAYVKNKSKMGKYYWVFAMAFPMSDGYLSIRLKPSSPLFAQVKKVYEKMSAIEIETSAMEASSQYLHRTLAEELGFASYEEFMRGALEAELRSRDLALGVQDKGLQVKWIADEVLRNVTYASQNCMDSVRTGFEVSSQFLVNMDGLLSQSQHIMKTCESVKMVTTNLTVASAKLGEPGKPLGVVAANLDKLTGEIAQCTKDLDEALKSFRQSAEDMCFTFGSSRFQIEMMDHLIRERVLQAGDLGAQSQTDSEKLIFLERLALLNILIVQNFKKVQETSLALTSSSRSLLHTCKRLSQTTAGMDVIRVVGKIEMARVDEVTGVLASRLKDVEDLTQAFKDSLRVLETDCRQGITNSLRVEQMTADVSNVLGTINSLIVV
ncbi:PAS domain-containing protein [Bdellovibrio svalbardensis]|uniref:PAS domain-containing protein n=1 Tax=Bdellovibrio svalbardensis TaxID=2972972 RepID=A0ABT6DP05_9BACT|nr:PAS domain-containing protein [Bdellovibrio svalbardensis]MDG0817820.1 PAS domain-containing protein [Bdellovibrio svalbardensis]